MKDIVDIAQISTPVNLPNKITAQFGDHAKSVIRRSTLVWGEHCSECAFPDCYANCSFYTPRRDLHCRRFENGIVAKHAGDIRFMEIKFRKWGKLEGKGPVGLQSIKDAQALETKDTRRTKQLLKAPIPQRIQNNLIWRWNERKTEKASEGPAPQGGEFIIEAFVKDGPNIPFTLTFISQDTSQGGVFQEGFALEPGYNRFTFKTRNIAQRIDLTRPYVVQIEPVGGTPDRSVLFGMIDFAELSEPVKKSHGKPAANDGERFKKTAKCVIWDLDNTMWDGTLAEDGLAGVKLRPKSVEMVKSLDARGILNSIASKNDEDAGLAALEHFGLSEYFLYPQIGWHPKSQSVKAIKEALDIGMNTFVFIDDQPFERGEVAETLDAVEVLPDTEIETLLERERFDVPATPEAAKRRLMYKDEERRRVVFKQDGGDYLEFLRSCDIQLTLLPLSNETITRAYELSQRTNQLNISGRRFERQELEKLMAGDGIHDVCLAHCKDRFGDYGVIGMYVLDREAARITAFMMSCRVQRKSVEKALFNNIAKQLVYAGKSELSVAFKRTERNQASVRMLEELGFGFSGGPDDDNGDFVRVLDAPFEHADIVNVIDERGTPSQGKAANTYQKASA